MGRRGDTTTSVRLTRADSSRRHFDAGDAYLRLAAIVGESPYLPVPPSPYPPVSPSSVTVTPGSIDEACDVMRLASAEGWSVIPAGAGTWLDVGNSMRGVELILSTTKLNRIIEHEPADLIATAEAGVTFHEFNSELAKRGQWLPLDPPDDLHATLGGVVATGLAGPQRSGYGAPRTFVIGMQVVLADGRRIKAGGRVVKNVAGYDLMKVMTGSRGTLGIIVEAAFKVRPTPKGYVFEKPLRWSKPSAAALGAFHRHCRRSVCRLGPPSRGASVCPC